MSTGFPDGPGCREPGLDRLISALTADGHPDELAGRDGALAAFRASRARRRGTGWRLLPGTPARVGAAAAALILAFAGLTVAAYAKALPAPVQHIAYNVFSPLGVPDNQVTTLSHASRQHGRPTRHARPARHEKSGPSPSPSCPCATATPRLALKGSALAITAARVRLPASGWDQFTARLTSHGRPETGIRIRLLERPAGSASWVLAGSGVTGGHGRIKVGITHLTANATFRFAGRNGVHSASVSVTVIPSVRIWRAPAKPGRDRLVAAAQFAGVGDAVELQKRSGSGWQNVTSGVLNTAHRASFSMSAGQAGGHYYRVKLMATNAHGGAVSAAIVVPAAKSGATAIVPSFMRMTHSATPRHGTGHRPLGTVAPGPVVVSTAVPTLAMSGPGASPTAEPSPDVA